MPDRGDEAVRDLVRAREDAEREQRCAPQRLKALLLRNGIVYVGRSSWTAAHLCWIARVKLPEPAQQLAFQECHTRAHRGLGAHRAAGAGTARSAARRKWVATRRSMIEPLCPVWDGGLLPFSQRDPAGGCGRKRQLADYQQYVVIDSQRNSPQFKSRLVALRRASDSAGTRARDRL